MKFLLRLLNASCSDVRYYSPSIFLASSQTAPAPQVVLTLMQDGAACNAKRAILTILRKNRGLWTVLYKRKQQNK